MSKLAQQVDHIEIVRQEVLEDDPFRPSPRESGMDLDGARTFLSAPDKSAALSEIAATCCVRADPVLPSLARLAAVSWPFGPTRLEHGERACSSSNPG
jgi:hypothetical protein